MKIRYLIFFILIIISCSSCSMKESTKVSDDTLVSVNGDVIMKLEIDEVYNQTDGKISYDKIVEDSIIELLVIQEAANYNINISEEELTEAFQSYKNNFPQYYEESLKIYSDEEIKNKLRNTNMFLKTKSYICENILHTPETITTKEYKGFLIKFGLEEYMQQYSQEFVVENLWSDIEEYLFLEWANNLRTDAEITYSN